MERFMEWESRMKKTKSSVHSVQERPQAREHRDIFLGEVKLASLKSRAQVTEESERAIALAASPAASPARQTQTPSPPTLSTSSAKTARDLAATRTNYYDSWDKFDVDKALEAIDRKETGEPISSGKKQLKAAPAPKSVPAASATDEKEKGNAAFKKGDYKSAIEHYTICMKLDPSNSVYPINRAMASLKLERFAEVEADCTTGLGLDPKNVKALWRRGIARRSLGKLAEARVDFEAALKIEPTNKSVKDELAKLNIAISEKPVTTAPLDAASFALATPMPANTTITKVESQQGLSGIKSSARVPIVEVDSDDDSDLFSKALRATSQTADAKPLPSLSSSDQTTALRETSPPPVTPTATTPAKPSISETLSTPAPSAITRATTTATPASAASAQKTSLAPTQVSVSSAAPSVKMTPPVTLLDFQRDWKSYSRDKQLLYQYLKLIKPQNMPGLFKSSFESDYFSSMLPIYQEFYITNEPASLLYDTLANLAKVQRFGMALMFISKSESQMLTELFQHLSKFAGASVYTAHDVSSLAAKYKVKLT